MSLLPWYGIFDSADRMDLNGALHRMKRCFWTP